MLNDQVYCKSRYSHNLYDSGRFRAGRLFCGVSSLFGLLTSYLKYSYNLVATKHKTLEIKH